MIPNVSMTLEFECDDLGFICDYSSLFKGMIESNGQEFQELTYNEG